MMVTIAKCDWCWKQKKTQKKKRWARHVGDGDDGGDGGGDDDDDDAVRRRQPVGASI